MGVSSTADSERVAEFARWLGTVPYPPPLKLNLEAFGEQEFLESSVTGGAQVRLGMQMKRFADLEAGRLAYRARFSKYASRRKSRELAVGVLTRAIQYTTPANGLKLTLLQLQAELAADGVARGVYSEAASQVLYSKVCEGKEKVKAIIRQMKAGW